MPKMLKYQKNSYVYYQGDIANKVYVLQQGAISLLSTNLQTNQPEQDAVAPGEFFGVKQTLGNHGRDESALVSQDSVVLAFDTAEFETFVTSNTRIALKMLKVFSSQLRNVHKTLNSILEQKSIDAENGLYNVGCYFLRQRQTQKAKYVFTKYMTEYPQGKYAAETKKKLAGL